MAVTVLDFNRDSIIIYQFECEYGEREAEKKKTKNRSIVCMDSVIFLLQDGAK